VALGLADAVARLVLVGCHLDLTNKIHQKQAASLEEAKITTAKTNWNV
jgi:hypothetical protein